MKKPDLSVLITARNEMFLALTVEDVLKNIRGNTEIIVVFDGTWAKPPIPNDPRVTIIYHSKSIGQRAAINEAARLSQSKFIMKLDAHCRVDEGFDIKLMDHCEYDWTVVPRLYNLHAFNWLCNKCENRTYQGPTPEKLCSCGGTIEREMIWQPRWGKKSDFMRFDKELVFQYWGDFGNRPEARADIADTMGNLGACWFMHRERYWDMDGLDEKHGSWGQMGTEISCKTWLSGGRQVVNKNTWYSHLFRTQGGDFGFPYPNNSREQARKYSQDLWRNNKWPKAKHDLAWLIQKFAPVPGWEEIQVVKNDTETHTDIPSKGILYYTDNQLNLNIAHAVQRNLKRVGLPITSVSLKPMKFGTNVYMKNAQRGYLTMAKQILAGLEAMTEEIVFFCEHDVLYDLSHFYFMPAKNDVFYYNENVWKVRSKDGHAVHYDCKQLSGLCCYRELAIKHFKRRVEILDRFVPSDTMSLNQFVRRMGFEPGTHNRVERVDDYKAEGWKSSYPNIDIRHEQNLTPSRWKQEQFRDPKNCQGWIESDNINGWGLIKEVLNNMKILQGGSV